MVCGLITEMEEEISLNKLKLLNEIRPIFKRLGQLAEQTGCAIVLVGHMNKMQGAKSAYRGLGSIDFRAAARSVLLVGRSKDDPETRVVVHDKSTTVHKHTDSKTLRREREKKIALGHKEDDHEEEQTWQQTM